MYSMFSGLTKIESIDVKDDGVMMLSLPYSEGWKIFVDGEEADKFIIGSAFTGIGLNKGSHNIQMIYTTPGLFYGAVVTFVSLALTMAVFIGKARKNKADQRQDLYATV